MRRVEEGKCVVKRCCREALHALVVIVKLRKTMKPFVVWQRLSANRSPRVVFLSWDRWACESQLTLGSTTGRAVRGSSSAEAAAHTSYSAVSLLRSSNSTSRYHAATAYSYYYLSTTHHYQFANQFCTHLTTRIISSYKKKQIKITEFAIVMAFAKTGPTYP